MDVFSRPSDVSRPYICTRWQPVGLGSNDDKFETASVMYVCLEGVSGLLGNILFQMITCMHEHLYIQCTPKVNFIHVSGRFLIYMACQEPTSVASDVI